MQQQDDNTSSTSSFQAASYNQQSSSSSPYALTPFYQITPSTSPTPPTTPLSQLSVSSTPKPYLIFEEEPLHVQRLRYESEGLGTIKGVNSTHGRKTMPTIAIVGYTGAIDVVISCISADEPYKPHPHQLTSRDTICSKCRHRTRGKLDPCSIDGASCNIVGSCAKGFYYAHLNSSTLGNAFNGLGIQSVKRNNIQASLRNLKQYDVDPYNYYKSNAHQLNNNNNSYDLKRFRLCIQAFITYKGNSRYGLEPLMSGVIHANDLVVRRICRCSASVEGNDEIMLMGANIPKEVRVQFYEIEEATDIVSWESPLLTPQEVYRGVVVRFLTPPYHSHEVKSNSKIFLRLIRCSDNAESTPIEFEYIPKPDNKRRKTADLLRKVRQSQEAAQAPDNNNVPEPNAEEIVNSLAYYIKLVQDLKLDTPMGNATTNADNL